MNTNFKLITSLAPECILLRGFMSLIRVLTKEKKFLMAYFRIFFPPRTSVHQSSIHPITIGVTPLTRKLGWLVYFFSWVSSCLTGKLNYLGFSALLLKRCQLQPEEQWSMKILKGFSKMATLALSFNHAGALKRINLAEFVTGTQQIMIMHM